MRVGLTIFILFLCSLTVRSQSGAGNDALYKHFVYFKDKANTPYSIQQPQQFLSVTAIQRRERYQIPILTRDLPVSPSYVAQLSQAGAKVWYTSRWFNGALIQCDTITLRKIKQLPFIRTSETVALRSSKKPQTSGQKQVEIQNFKKIEFQSGKNQSEFGEAYGQAKLIGVPEMHQAGFRGEGMRIAVFDGGFSGVNRVPAFAQLFRDNRIKATFDFVDKDTGVFEKDSHGTQVLSTMAANIRGAFVGTAPKAEYALFITEDVGREQRLEEINWLLAAEFADSAGVDIIQSSLGYNLFDKGETSYTYQDFNGDKAISTRAADFAAAAGMLVIVSAGNEGNDPWQYITAPADADSVLSIGATDSLGRRAVFSSIGPSYDGRIKPDLSGQGLLAAVINPAGNVIRANGTSFSAPIICGLAAGFWQANRQLSNVQVMDYLKLSGSQATNPDNRLGFGIPHYRRAQTLADQLEGNLNGEFRLYPNPVPVDENHFTIILPLAADQNTEFRLYNAVGQEVSQFSYQYGKVKSDRTFITFELKGMAPGIYHCVISGPNSSETIRFLKL
ncbi:S8 family serine peptidase [Adhaeribacter swui]|uniref:S8 family serine peptidase n=1 Tax=Adhaeribacter swui TaxID=2086471 RepID=A0A7G7GD35_9BACT|nr:S8 family serine peptidase [Adhaeribacter swui]QNF35069.1 S8 family serine peptidase [Adhaeribacter swui]